MQNPNFETQTETGGRLTELGAASKPLTRTQKYEPVAPPRSERRAQILRHAFCLPRTLWRIFRIIREDLATAALDESLWSFWSFHQEVEKGVPRDPHCRMRTWDRVKLSAIGPQNVVDGLAVWELAFMMNFAMENEDPIFEYTHQSGEGFRFLLPGVGRFMGKNQEQASYSARHKLPWCESAWCAEERRHSNTFARMIERLVHISPSRENPNHPMVVTAGESDAVQHLIARRTSEWNAASSYIVMAAHSSGDLRTLVRNIVRDEVKHLAILSSADCYLFGPRPWTRMLTLVRLGLENYRNQRKIRSGGNILGGNAALSIEGIFSHAMTALFLTKWLRGLPLRLLAEVFETSSRLPDLAAAALPAERQQELELTLERGKEKREGLLRWVATDRNKALDRRGFEVVNADALQEIVARQLRGFRGGEEPGSEGEKRIRKLIRGVTVGGMKSRQLRSCLLDRLRQYQIHHNRHVTARESGLAQSQPQGRVSHATLRVGTSLSSESNIG